MMKKLLIAVMMMGLVSVASADEAGISLSNTGAKAAIGYGLLAGAVYLMITDKETACDREPVRKVKWTDNPGFSFEVAGCDYQAKKDKLTLVN